MKGALPVKIAGLGCYLPPRVVSNAQLEARCNLPDGWIEQRTGVRQRRWVEEETAAFMAAQAAADAAADAGLCLGQIDLILNASGTPQQALPDGGPLVQRELGLGDSGIPCFSVHATCLSFVVALNVAARFLLAGPYRRILIVSADVASCGLDFDEPESASLLGDAAAAAVLVRTPAGEGSRLSAFHLATYGCGAELTQIRGGGSGKHPNHPATRPQDNLFHMKGLQVLKLTRQHGRDFLERLSPGLSRGLGGIRWVVPHQASKIGLDMLQHYGWPPERLLLTLERFGNCVAASIPLTLCQAVKTGRVQRGDELLLVGTGAGLSIGGVILTF